MRYATLPRLAFLLLFGGLLGCQKSAQPAEPDFERDLAPTPPPPDARFPLDLHVADARSDRFDASGAGRDAANPDAEWPLDALPGDAVVPPCDCRVPPTHDALMKDAALVGLDAAPEDASRPTDGLGGDDRRVPDAGPDAGPFPLCPEPPPDIEDCLLGAAFADCFVGDGPPAVFCNFVEIPGRPPCLWFTGGCPASDYEIPCSAPLTCPAAIRCEVASPLRYDWGPDAWDRDRAMNLVPLEGHVNAPPQPEFVCTACDRLAGHEGEPAPANCLPDPSVCAGVELGIYETESGPFAETTLYTVTLWVLDDWTRWTGVLEVLYQGGVPDVARLCLLPTTDFLNTCDSGGPICADGGTLEVDASGERLHGAGTAFFGPFGFSGPDAPPEFAGMQVDFRF